MQPSDDAHEQLHKLALQTMPPPPWFCILCESSPDYMGVGRVDGKVWAYCICHACVERDYVPAVIATVRAWTLQRQRN